MSLVLILLLFGDSGTAASRNRLENRALTATIAVGFVQGSLAQDPSNPAWPDGEPGAGVSACSAPHSCYRRRGSLMIATDLPGTTSA